MNILKKIKWPFHWMENLYRRYRYGVGCCDLYGYNYYLAEIIARDLKLFKKNNYSHPCDTTAKEWDQILEDMILGFEAIVKLDDAFKSKEIKKLQKQHKKGIKLFAKYYQHLWI